MHALSNPKPCIISYISRFALKNKKDSGQQGTWRVRNLAQREIFAFGLVILLQLVNSAFSVSLAEKKIESVNEDGATYVW